MYDDPPRNWRNAKKEETYCILHAPAEEKADINNFNFQLKLHIKKLLNQNQAHYINLSGAIFPHKLRFADLFQNLDNSFINLTNCTFVEDVYFSDLTNGNAFNCNQSEFCKEVFFSNTKFISKFDLLDITFQDNVYFDSADLTKGLLIANTRFNKRFFIKNGQCSNITVLASDFYGNTFFENTMLVTFELVNSKFLSNIHFYNTCQDYINFNHNYFAGDAEFYNTNILGSFKFENNICNAGVYFNNVDCTGSASFARTRFNDFTSLRFSKFSSNLNFNEACAKETIYFERVEFAESVDFGAFTANKTIQLSWINMHKIILNNAPIEAFCFTNCVWPQADGHFRVANHSTSKPNDLIDVYRRQKKISKLNHDELRASDWHWQEKEMLLKTKTTPPVTYYFLIFYRFLSGYGEEPQRAFWVLIALLALPVILFAYFEPFQYSDQSKISWSIFCNVFTDWYNCLPLSKFSPYEEYSILRKVSYLLFQVCITLQASLLAFSLRNKLRR
ncbi:hypothetical protein [Paucidesulfovibrio longus]|uniref:hypothetical protein n=1 Tax=Paucidesulfovibrio longus TaxID=889 RepID=UPI0012DDD42C|nr:hypothetical protein [Paucidesulfovibrio longus]